MAIQLGGRRPVSTPRCIARDLFADVAALVDDAGVCDTSDEGQAVIIRQINLAAQAIVKRVDMEGMLWDFPCPVKSGCFALPPDCESPRNVFVNGFSATMRDQWYEGKLSWGRNDNWQCVPQNQVIDEGQFAIPLPLPKTHSMRVALVAENNGDAGKECVIEVVNQYGTRVKETLTLLGNGQPVVTNSMVYDVTLFNKPRTNGCVQLQISYDDGQRMQTGSWPYFARYQPLMEHCYWRRMKLPQRCGGCQMVVVKGKMKLYPIKTADDIVPFDDVHAWRFALSGIDAQTRGDNAKFEENMVFAVRELARSMQNSDPAGNVARARFSSGFWTSPSWAGGRRCWT